MYILKLALLFTLPCLSCVAQPASTTNFLHDEIQKSMQELDEDAHVDKRMLLEKAKSYKNMSLSDDFTKEISRICEELATSNFDIVWYYNPLEYKNYSYVIFEVGGPRFLCYEYIEPTKMLRHFGTSSINTTTGVAQNLANVNVEDIDDSIFFVSSFRDGETTFVLSRKFDLFNHFQILIAHLECQFSN